MSDNDVLIAALLTARTIREAAARAEVSESTMYRRLKDPEFVAVYREARREVVQHATVRLQQALTDAIDALVEVVKDKAGNQNARVAAARVLLDQALRATENEEIVPRLEALESKRAA
jgi:hypothetical protein